VLDEFGSDASRVGSSRQTEAQGEFGVTCNARAVCVKNRMERRELMVVKAILMFGPEQAQV
jgi:hypothetical protein